jgi:hypothetical protein
MCAAAAAGTAARIYKYKEWTTYFKVCATYMRHSKILSLSLMA